MTIVFPLKSRRLIRGFQAHVNAGLRGAVDYEADRNSLYSPVNGSALLFNESQGGNWIQITDEMGRKWEMAHLSERYVTTGDQVVAGQLIGKTGNTGTVTSGPHLHLQIVHPYPNRIDPEPLLINAPLSMPENHDFDNKLIRLAPGLNYALVIRGKKSIFPRDDNTLRFILVLEKTGAILVPRVTQAEWDSLPLSDGLKF